MLSVQILILAGIEIGLVCCETDGDASNERVSDKTQCCLRQTGQEDYDVAHCAGDLFRRNPNKPLLICAPAIFATVMQESQCMPGAKSISRERNPLRQSSERADCAERRLKQTRGLPVLRLAHATHSA